MIQSVNGGPVRRLADLLRLRDATAGPPLTVGIVRGQQAQALHVEAYNYCVEETTADGNFRIVPLAPAGELVTIKRISTQPGTRNEAPAVLHDGRIAKNYGPVFANGVIGGAYKADLGAAIELAEINAWSYHQNGNRGMQRYVLFGSDATADPGWNVGDRTKFVPITEVDTTSAATRRFQATGIRRSGGRPLGAFRWLVWLVYPVTDIDENTAYQEFQVKPARDFHRQETENK